MIIQFHRTLSMISLLLSQYPVLCAFETSQVFSTVQSIGFVSPFNSQNILFTIVFTLTLACLTSFSIIASCPVPMNLTNGTVMVNRRSVENTATFFCVPGYELVGDITLTCGNDRKWNSDLPVCTPYISPPIHLSSSTKSTEQSSSNNQFVHTSIHLSISQSIHPSIHSSVHKSIKNRIQRNNKTEISGEGIIVICTTISAEYCSHLSPFFCSIEGILL